MRVVRRGSRLAATAAVTLGLGIAGVATAGPAAAASVSAKCRMPGFATVVPWTWNPKVTFAPSSAKVGDSVKITVTLPEGYSNGPAVAVKNSDLTPFVYLSVGGTEVVAKGTTTTPGGVAAPNQPISFGPFTGTYKASKAGDQKVVMTKAFFDYLGSKSKIDTTCTPDSKPTLATLTVSSGGSSSGNNNSGNSGSNSSSNSGSNTSSNTSSNSGSNNSSGANTNSGNSKNNNKSSGKDDLAKTGAGDAWITAIIAAVALQLGLIAYVRARRRPVTIRRAV